MDPATNGVTVPANREAAEHAPKAVVRWGVGKDSAVRTCKAAEAAKGRHATEGDQD